MVPTSVTVTEGGDAEYTVRLATEPTATVTVAITGHSGTDLTLDPSSARLTFTTSNWNTVQTVTVSAAEDGDATNDMATLAHAASGGDYGSATADLAVTVTDNDTDTAGLVVPTSVTVTEGGDAEYTVRLATEPTATVTVTVGTITGHSGTDLAAEDADPHAASGGDSASLTFTTSNWFAWRQPTCNGDGGDHGLGPILAEDVERRANGERHGDAGPCGLGRRLRLGDGGPGGDGDRQRQRRRGWWCPRR